MRRNVLFVYQELRHGEGIQRILATLDEGLRESPDWDTRFFLLSSVDKEEKVSAPVTYAKYARSLYGLRLLLRPPVLLNLLDIRHQAQRNLLKLLLKDLARYLVTFKNRHLFLFLRAINYGYQIKQNSEQGKVDVIVGSGHMNYIVAISKMLFNTPGITVASVHSPVELYDQALNGTTYPAVDRVVCVSKALAVRMRHKYGYRPAQVKYAPNAVDIERVKRLAQEAPQPEDEHLLKGNGPIFINVGTIKSAKGHSYLIRSFTQVIKAVPNARLLIVGHALLESRLELLHDLICQLGATDNISIIGYRSNVYPYLKRAHCFVSSSLWEGFHIAILEALAVGVPVISTDVQVGPREILAPELDPLEQIEYPYHARYGILTRPIVPNIDISEYMRLGHSDQLARDKFDTLDKTPLDIAEQKLADVMIASVKNPETLNRSDEITSRVKEYNIGTLVQSWREALS